MQCILHAYKIITLLNCCAFCVHSLSLPLSISLLPSFFSRSCLLFLSLISLITCITVSVPAGSVPWDASLGIQVAECTNFEFLLIEVQRGNVTNVMECVTRLEGNEMNNLKSDQLNQMSGNWMKDGEESNGLDVDADRYLEDLALEWRHPTNIVRAKGRTGTSLVTMALWYDHLDIVLWLLGRGALLEKDIEGSWPIHLCALHGNAMLLSAVEGWARGFLEGVSGKFISTTNHRNTVRSYGRMSGKVVQQRKEQLDFALELSNGTITDQDGFTALHLAADGGHLEFIGRFLQLYCDGALVNSNSSFDSGNDQFSNELTREKCVNLQSDHGITPSMLAASRGHLETLKILHKNGANFLTQNKHGSDALAWAVQGGHLEIVKYFHLNGISLHQKNV